MQKIVRETDKAFLLQIDYKDYWIPKSQIADADECNEGDKDCTVSVTEFIAKQKGLADEV